MSAWSETRVRTDEQTLRSRGAPANGPRAELQRARILAAMVEIVAADGYKAASLDAVVRRARVSRRTFYALFGSLDDCFGALLLEGLERAGAIVGEALERGDSWESGVLGALSGLLVLFDCEPELARVWLVESVVAAGWAVEQRERYLAELRDLVMTYWRMKGGAMAPAPDSPVVVGVMAAVVGVIHTHLLTRRSDPLIVLLGPLMGLVTSTYLDPTDAAREIGRGDELSKALLAVPYPPAQWPARAIVEVGVPEALRDPRAHRARICLLYLLRDPGASNSEIASGVGIASHGQISKLLSRLLGMGLLVKVQAGAGRPNSWSLSEAGTHVAHALEDMPD